MGMSIWFGLVVLSGCERTPGPLRYVSDVRSLFRTLHKFLRVVLWVAVGGLHRVQSPRTSVQRSLIRICKSCFRFAGLSGCERTPGPLRYFSDVRSLFRTLHKLLWVVLRVGPWWPPSCSKPPNMCSQVIHNYPDALRANPPPRSF